jgi:hypothetical protein
MEKYDQNQAQVRSFGQKMFSILSKVYFLIVQWKTIIR